MDQKLLPKLDKLITELENSLNKLKRLREDPERTGFDYGVGDAVDAMRHAISNWETGK